MSTLLNHLMFRIREENRGAPKVVLLVKVPGCFTFWRKGYRTLMA